jgi:hypothetical protein
VRNPGPGGTVIGNTFEFSVIYGRENPAVIYFRALSATRVFLRLWH